MRGGGPEMVGHTALRAPAGTGPDRALDQQALLARLLSPATGEDRAGDCASSLLDRFGSIAGSLAAPGPEVQRLLADDGSPCALQLRDLHDLVVSVLRQRLCDRPILSSRAGLKGYLLAALAHEAREQLRVLYLDNRNGLILEEITGVGTRNHAPVYPREIVRRALELGANALILVHNHPSGDPRPSAADLSMTDQVVAWCAVFQIEVHDHVIVGRGKTFSFEAQGLLPRGETRFEHSLWLRKRRGVGAGRVTPRGEDRQPATASLHE
ncbi:MAG: DNA repair protein RadC [Caulobacteraceae bacterium]|nr:DNA repair protein RadC [Caulobacteraceae bacterium]